MLLEKALQFMLSNILAVNERFELVYFDLNSEMIFVECGETPRSPIRRPEVVLVFEFFPRLVRRSKNVPTSFIRTKNPMSSNAEISFCR